MTDSLLHKLSELTTIVPETADLALVRRLGSEHVSLGAALIAAAAHDPAHAGIVDDAIGWAQRDVGKGGNRKLVSMRAAGRLAVEFAEAIAKSVRGHVSVEVDGRLAFKRRPTVDKARELSDQLVELDVPKDKILVKIPATWEGIEAAQVLHHKSGIGCHMTLVFGMHQAAACADAGAVLISPAVGRITDWHKKQDGVAGYPPSRDPGVLAALEMRDYLRSHGYTSSHVMPATFRTVEQALALAGMELLALPEKLLELLAEQHGGVAVVVDRAEPPSGKHARLAVDGPTFAAAHAADAMAKEKLAGGVRNLGFATVSQEKQLAEWIARRQDEAAESSTVALFKIWDYDGDGYIDREEWGGTSEVFNALDRDGNGRISLEEMAIGLGAPYRPDDE